MAHATSSVDTRTRIVTAATELFRIQGYNGTSMAHIVKAAEATTGSVYHFFPGGKDELTAAVLRESGKAYADFVLAIIGDAIDVARGLEDAFEGGAAVLAGGDFIDLCPIGTIAREVASTNESLRQVADEVMTEWVNRLIAVLGDAGVDPPHARSLAAFIVAAIEGGFVLARATKDEGHFLAAGKHVVAVVASAIGSTD